VQAMRTEGRVVWNGAANIGGGPAVSTTSLESLRINFSEEKSARETTKIDLQVKLYPMQEVSLHMFCLPVNLGLMIKLVCVISLDAP